jgi:hypothetical protein
MTRPRVAIAVVVALLLGAAAGAYGGFTYAVSILGAMETTGAASRAIDNIASSVALLESLRAGKLDAVMEPLEMRLDSALIMVGALPRDYLATPAPPALQRAVDYRTKNPRKSSNPVVEAAIQRGLARAKE